MISLRLRLLGLCTLVFGLIALNATSAQATAGAKWLILKSAGVLMSEAEVNTGKASALLEDETTIVLHTKISGIAVLYECKKVQAVNAFLLANGSIGESAGNVKGSKIRLSECINKLNGVTNDPCEPNAGGKEKGVIVTQAGHALLELHELTGGAKDDILRLLPDTGETVAFIEASDECAIGEKIPLIGKLTLKDCQNLALTHLVKHLVEAGPLTELWTISKTVEHTATILGSAWASLGGIGGSLSWDGDLT